MITQKEAIKMKISLYPNLRGIVDVPFVTPELNNLSGCDVVFFATASCVARVKVPAISRLPKELKVIDLSADFRIARYQ